MILSAKLSSRSKSIESLSLKSITLSFIFTEIVIGLSIETEKSSSISVLLSVNGKTPFLKQLLKKISPNELAITTSIPKSLRAQTACSLLEPHPKLSLVSKTFDSL